MVGREVQRSPRRVRVAGGQAADLGAGCSVQQCEQAGEPFMGMGGVAGPSPEQCTLGACVQDVCGKGRLAAQTQGDGRVDKDELAALRPAEEAAQDIGPLVRFLGLWPRNASRSAVVTWDPPVTGRADVRWMARSRRVPSLVSRVVSLTGYRPARRARSRSSS